MPYDFYDYAAVRTLLGLSAKELPDTEIAQDTIANQLTMDFLSIDVDILDYYDNAVAEDTDAALNFVLALDTYAPLAVATFLLPGLPQFSPRSVTDGKAGFTRFSDSPYKVTIDRVQQARFDHRRRLRDFYSVYLGLTPEPLSASTRFAVSTPTYDPVTG